MRSFLDLFNFAAGVVGIGGMFRLGWLLMDYLWRSPEKRRNERISAQLERLLSEHPVPSSTPEKPQPTGGRLIKSERDPKKISLNDDPRSSYK